MYRVVVMLNISLTETWVIFFLVLRVSPRYLGCGAHGAFLQIPIPRKYVTNHE